MTKDRQLAYSYKVLVDDNFHYMDESERYQHGEFNSCESAIAACKRIVDEFLLPESKSRGTAEELLRIYMMFGEDPFIITGDPTCKFSAWDYARERCGQLFERR